jgi:hypothetical protein
MNVPVELVPVPLSSAWWSDAVFHRAVKADNLFAAIVSSSRAALLCHGLAALDDETLEYVSGNRKLVDYLGGDAAPLFAAFANSIRVHDGHAVPPGGDEAVALWENVVGERVARPDAFIRALLSAGGGHLAYFFDLVNELDAPRARFVLGLWLNNDGSRAERFRSLVASNELSLADWRPRDRPFSRRLDDIAWLLLNVTVDSSGTPQGLVTRRFWQRVFESSDVPPTAVEATRIVVDAGGDSQVDAAWLAESILLAEPRLRHSRLEQLGFGFRAFPSVAPDMFGEALTAIRGLVNVPAVMLTLERMGGTSPSVYADAARAAVRLSTLDGAAAYVAIAQYQGALALLSSMTLSGGLESARANALAGSLAGLPLGGGYGSRVAAWVGEQLLPALAPRAGADETVLAALAGASTKPAEELPRIVWEGERYRLDLTTSEVERLRAQRDRQGSLTIDSALALEQVARDLGAEDLDLDTVHKSTEALRNLLPQLAPANNAAARPIALAPGAQDLPVPRTALDRIVKDLAVIVKPADVRKAAALSGSIGDLSGVVLASALAGTVYAAHLGDPSAARLDADLARRHDFGLDLKDREDRRFVPWQVPRQSVEPGTPRHVVGSLLGLDVAFANLTLRRVSLESSGNAPALLANDRTTFTKTVALLNPYALRDSDRDLMATAIEKGRARVSAAATVGPAALNALADEIRVDGWRRRAAEWEIYHGSRTLLTLFSLDEFLALGGGGGASLNAWGAANTPISGCLCARLPAPNEWRIVTGRPQLGVMASAVADLNLQVAIGLSALKVPAPLAKSVLGAVVQSFVEDVQPNDPDDWLTLVRTASAVSRERIEDAVAGAAAGGPLLPEQGYQDRARR